MEHYNHWKEQHIDSEEHCNPLHIVEQQSSPHHLIQCQELCIQCSVYLLFFLSLVLSNLREEDEEEHLTDRNLVLDRWSLEQGMNLEAAFCVCDLFCDVICCNTQCTEGDDRSAKCFDSCKAAQKLRHSTRIGRHVPLTSTKDLEIAIL